MKKSQRITVASIAVGIVFGIAGGPAIILIPWALAALVFGYYSNTRKEALLNGFLFGFFASFFFMVHGYNGVSSAVSRIPFFGGLGAFGGLCGLVLSLVGNFISKRYKK